MGQGLLVRRGGQGGGGLNLESISISVNGLYRATDLNVDGWNVINVNVNGSEDMLAELANRTITSLYNNNITYIPTYFIYGCPQLSEVVLPNAVSIGNNGVAVCSNLKLLSLPNLYYANANEFDGLSQLESFYLPNYISGSLPQGNSFPVSDLLVSEQFIASSINGGINMSLVPGWNSSFNSLGVSVNGKMLLTYNTMYYNSTQFYGSYNILWHADSSALVFPYEVGYITSSFYSAALSASSVFSSVLTISASGLKTVSNAFCQFRYATSIYMPELVAIGGSTFITSSNYISTGTTSSYWSPISSIVVGDLYSAGTYAFVRCSSLSTIGISNLTRLKYVGYYAFHNCNQLELSVNLDTVEFVGDYAFYNCKKIDFYGSLNNFIFENTSFWYFKGQSIGQYAFAYTNIKQLETNAYAIGSYAFYGCSSLSYVNLNDASRLWNSAFNNCSSLKYISAPNLTLINTSAVANCSELLSVYFPKLSGLYASGLFAGCSNVESFVIDFSNLYSYSQKLFGIFSKLSNLISSTYYFSALGISDYILTGWQTAMTSSTVNCYYIDGGIYGNTAPMYLNCPNLKFVPDYKFSNNNRIYSFRAENCSIVGNYAFSYARYLTSVSLDNCEYIYTSAFYSCSNLSDLYIPKVKYIYQGAFFSCGKLKSLELSQCIEIGNAAFSNCRSLSYISVPKVERIYGYAFYACVSLLSFEALTLSSITMTSLFANCDKLSYVNLSLISIPNGVSSNASIGITLDGFYNCVSLAYFSLSYISNYYLYSIAQNAFYNCSKLTNLKFEIGRVTSNMTIYAYIGANAFVNCNTVSKIYIKFLNNYMPLSIMSTVFQSCSSLQSLYFRTCASSYSTNSAVVVFTYSNLFNLSPMVDSSYLGHFGSIYVNASLLDYYKSATNWVYFSDRLVGLTDEEFDQVEANW